MKTITMDYKEYQTDLSLAFEKGVESIDPAALDDAIAVIQSVLDGTGAYTLANNWMAKHMVKK